MRSNKQEATPLSDSVTENRKKRRKCLTDCFFLCYIRLAMEAVFFLCLKTDLAIRAKKIYGGGLSCE